ncbi:hypothetical protein H4582DRAFT_2086664 [Lactarius indigo]|nr:hypothetical protein H4582DRAFT_2086664 [Lactarius indigo]
MYAPGPHQFSLFVCQTTSASLCLTSPLLLPSSHPSYLTTVNFVSDYPQVIHSRLVKQAFFEFEVEIVLHRYLQNIPDSGDMGS